MAAGKLKSVYQFGEKFLICLDTGRINKSPFPVFLVGVRKVSVYNDSQSKL